MLPTPEQLELVAGIRHTAEAVFAADEMRWETDPEYPRRGLALLGEHRLLGLNIPEAHGGLGLGNFEAMLAVEEMAKVSPDAASLMAASSLGQAHYILRFGTEAQRRRYLPAICAGKTRVAIAISEPEAGTAATALRTRATEDGDHFVLDGRKHYCSGATLSDVFVVYARMTRDPGAKGIGAILVDAGTPGFRIERLSENMAGNFQADLVFDNCRVPKENLLLPGGAFATLTRCYNLERCGGTAAVLGTAQGAFDRAVDYVQERRQFNRALVDFQAVQMKLADMVTLLEAGRLLLYRAIARNPHDFPDPQDAAMAKLFVNDAAKTVTDHAIQLFGAAGYLRTSGIERRYRIVRGASIAGGVADIQRVMIAGRLVGRSFSQWAPRSTDS